MEQQSVDVHRDSLLSEARNWDDQGNAMGQVLAEIGAAHPSLENVALDPVVAPIFNIVSPFVGSIAEPDYELFYAAFIAYDQIRTTVAEICQQGQRQLHRIADALNQATRNYDAAENESAQSAEHID